MFTTVWAAPEAGKPCLLVVGLLSSGPAAQRAAMGRLWAGLGPCFYVSEALPFTYTDYYAPEMGTGLERRFMAFSRLWGEESLPALKRWCIALEGDFLAEGRRRVNIDPGLLTAGSFVLASTKPAAHRLLLGDSIYGELTLLFQHGEYAPLPWTYPDYASPGSLALLLGWRNHYLWLLRQRRSENP